MLWVWGRFRLGSSTDVQVLEVVEVDFSLSLDVLWCVLETRVTKPRQHLGRTLARARLALTLASMDSAITPPWALFTRPSILRITRSRGHHPAKSCTNQLAPRIMASLVQIPVRFFDFSRRFRSCSFWGDECICASLERRQIWMQTTRRARELKVIMVPAGTRNQTTRPPRLVNQARAPSGQKPG